MPSLAWSRHNLNRSPHAPYNDRMPSRPQFSLRTLLLVTVMVCLAAATLNEPPDAERAPRGMQALLRAALCVAFSAALVVAAMHSDGYMKTFYMGGCAAAALPLLVLVETLSGSFDRWDSGPSFFDFFMLSNKETSPYRWWFAKLWASVPVFGLAAIGFDWLFQLSAQRDRGPALTRRRFFIRAALFTTAAACLAAMIALPAPADSRLAVTQSWLSECLCIFFGAVLATGAVQGSGYFKTFCLGGVLPALLAVVWLYVAILFLDLTYSRTSGLSQWVFVFEDDMRLLWAVHWAFIPVLGAACVVCDWLVQRGKGRAKQE